jgi:hypothetical protein
MLRGKVTMLGTGTSHGVPMIGCTCTTCRSTDPRDRRLRPSIYIDVPDRARILVDTATDFLPMRTRITSSGSMTSAVSTRFKDPQFRATEIARRWRGSAGSSRMYSKDRCRKGAASHNYR